MPESTSYEQLLHDLLEEREEIDRMIGWVQKRLGQAQEPSEATGLAANASPTVSLRFPRLATDAFFRMTVPQAIKAFLNIVKRPKSAKDITAGLQGGGLIHKAKNLYATVYPTLLRMEKAKEVVRVSKGEWGLAEWYPSARKAGGEERKDESEN